MKKYTIRFREIDRKIFEQAKSGEKSVETRAATTKYKDIKKGDTLVFVCGKDKFEKDVKKSQKFKSIKDLLKNYNIKNIMPDLSTLEEATERYRSFPGYVDKIKKFGIIALEV